MNNRKSLKRYKKIRSFKNDIWGRLAVKRKDDKITNYVYTFATEALRRKIKKEFPNKKELKSVRRYFFFSNKKKKIQRFLYQINTKPKLRSKKRNSNRGILLKIKKLVKLTLFGMIRKSRINNLIEQEKQNKLRLHFTKNNDDNFEISMPKESKSFIYRADGLLLKANLGRTIFECRQYVKNQKLVIEKLTEKNFMSNHNEKKIRNPILKQFSFFSVIPSIRTKVKKFFQRNIFRAVRKKYIPSKRMKFKLPRLNFILSGAPYFLDFCYKTFFCRVVKPGKKKKEIFGFPFSLGMNKSILLKDILSYSVLEKICKRFYSIKTGSTEGYCLKNAKKISTKNNSTQNSNTKNNSTQNNSKKIIEQNNSTQNNESNLDELNLSKLELTHTILVDEKNVIRGHITSSCISTKKLKEENKSLLTYIQKNGDLQQIIKYNNPQKKIDQKNLDEFFYKVNNSNPKDANLFKQIFPPIKQNLSTQTNPEILKKDHVKNSTVNPISSIPQTSNKNSTSSLKKQSPAENNLRKINYTDDSTHT